VTDTFSSTCSATVLVHVNCSSRCRANTCLTAEMLYSVSSSVSDAGAELLNTGPSAAKRGMLRTRPPGSPFASASCRGACPGVGPKRRGSASLCSVQGGRLHPPPCAQDVPQPAFGWSARTYPQVLHSAGSPAPSHSGGCQWCLELSGALHEHYAKHTSASVAERANAWFGASAGAHRLGGSAERGARLLLLLLGRGRRCARHGCLRSAPQRDQPAR